MQGETRHALLRRLLRASTALAASGGVGHGMGFVEDDHPVKVGAQPIYDLVQPRGPIPARRLPQGGVGRVEDAPVQPDRVRLLPRGLGRDVGGGPADGAPVAAGVLQQGVILRQPDRPMAALGQVVGDDAGDLSALATSSAVTEEEALTERHGARVIVLDQHHLVRRRAGDPRARQDLRVRLAGIDHRLHLGVGDQALAGDLLRQLRPVGRRRRRDRGHGSGFHERGGVGLHLREGDAAERVGLVEADVVALARPGLGLIDDRRRGVQEGQAVGGGGQRPGPRGKDRHFGQDAELAGLGRRAGLDARRRPGRVGQGFSRDHRLHRRVAGAAIDHEQAGLDRGPVLGVGAGREGQTQDNPAPLGQATLGGRVLKQPGRDDGRQPAAVGQAVEGGVQVRLQLLEGRIGHHGVEAARPGENIAQVLRIVGGAGGGREQPVEQTRAARGDLVESQGRAASLGQNRQEAGAGRRLKHLVAGADLGGQHGQGAQLRRG